MAAQDVYLLKDNQTYLGETLMNVYTYYHLEGEGGAQELAEAFEASVLPDIQAIQNIGVVHDDLNVLNYNDDEDFYVMTLGSSYVGGVSGEAFPRYNAWGYILNRATRQVRNGGKRYAGVSENWQTGGVANAGTALTALEALAITLGARLSDVSGNSWELKIPSFVGGPAIPIPQPISEVTYDKMTTQNSRKR